MRCGIIELAQMFEAQIKITLKKTVADPQGLTIKHALESLGFSNLTDARMGKLINLNLNQKDRAEAEAEVNQICQKLLANPIIEDYSFEIYPK